MTSPVSTCGPPIAAPVDTTVADALVDVDVDVVLGEPKDREGRLGVTDGGGNVNVNVSVGGGGRVIADAVSLAEGVVTVDVVWVKGRLSFYDIERLLI